MSQLPYIVTTKRQDQHFAEGDRGQGCDVGSHLARDQLLCGDSATGRERYSSCPGNAPRRLQREAVVSRSFARIGGSRRVLDLRRIPPIRLFPV